MFVSVIVPVHNAEDHLERTLSAIKRSDHRGYELIVVDDNSQDNSAQISRKFTDQVLELKERRAPGFARNQGAQMSKGDILFFIDADVEIDDHALSRVVQEFSQHPEVAAVFGSYDDEPLCKNFFSQYKNLFHHFVHQKAKEEAKTFWAGCGAVRSRDFFNAGGFAENFPTSSIEDVVLGYRMAQQGLMIRLLKDLRAKHLKKWTFLSLLKTDIFQRAIPWTRLASQKGLPNRFAGQPDSTRDGPSTRQAAEDREADRSSHVRAGINH